MQREIELDIIISAEGNVTYRILGAGEKCHDIASIIAKAAGMTVQSQKETEDLYQHRVPDVVPIRQGG